MRLSIIVPTKGRSSLRDTLASIAGQVEPGDEVLIDVCDDAPWGHRARHRKLDIASGDGLLFIDDDDFYMPGALGCIRAAFDEQPEAVHIFKMRYPDSSVIWQTPEVKLGNVSTQMVCVPNDPERLGSWDSDRYTADFSFIVATVDKIGAVAWHSDVICEVGLADDVRRPLPHEFGW